MFLHNNGKHEIGGRLLALLFLSLWGNWLRLFLFLRNRVGGRSHNICNFWLVFYFFLDFLSREGLVLFEEDDGAFLLLLGLGNVGGVVQEFLNNAVLRLRLPLRHFRMLLQRRSWLLVEFDGKF